jgi:hypothetical protein
MLVDVTQELLGTRIMWPKVSHPESALLAPSYTMTDTGLVLGK